MIVKHPSYKYPSKYEIEKAKDLVGYHHYTPPKLVLDLLGLYSHYMITESISYAISTFKMSKRSTPYMDIKIALYTSLDYDYYRGRTPVEKVFYTLKNLAKVIDFHKFEDNDPEFGEFNHNYEETPEADEESILNSEGIVDIDSVAHIMKLLSKFESNFKVGNNPMDIVPVRTKMKTFKDVFKARKSDLVKPDFKHKLINKKIMIGGCDAISDPEEDIIIYIEDASSSMLEDNGLVVSKALQILMTRDHRRVHYYRYVDSMLEFYDIITMEEKIECFSKPKTFKQGGCNYETLFKMINGKYETGNVIISTDGKDHVPKYKGGRLKYNCVGTCMNKYMAQYIKASGGIYLTI